MADRSAIEWTEATWNPVTGCTKVSRGCTNCYAERLTERFQGKGAFRIVRQHPNRLDIPSRWRRPRVVFVNSMSDLFHDQVEDAFIGQVFDVMGRERRHTFQVLTKRPERMRSVLRGYYGDRGLPAYPNVWLGVSCEDQEQAQRRLPGLKQTPAAIRFLSCEPLLGPLDLEPWLASVDWVIVGGESGPKARPMAPGWARGVRDQCLGSGTPFFFKQWGEHDACMRRRGKKAAGRTLDGRSWDQLPSRVRVAPGRLDPVA